MDIYAYVVFKYPSYKIMLLRFHFVRGFRYAQLYPPSIFPYLILNGKFVFLICSGVVHLTEMKCKVSGEKIVEAKEKDFGDIVFEKYF